MKSHLIAKVILREFADDNGKLKVCNKNTGDAKDSIPDDIAFREIEAAIIRESEQLWNRDLETKLKKTLNILKNGDVLRYDKHKRILKECLALHFVRSTVMMALVDEAKRFYADQIINETSTVYPQQTKDLEATIRSEWASRVEASIPEIIEENRKKITDYLNNHELEIGYASDRSRFLIGDIPAITFGEDGTMGVAILDAVNFGMPLTPRHLVTIKTNTESLDYINLTDKQVDAANSKQVDRAISEYYTCCS